MGKNKPVRNAFYYFMQDFKAKQPRKFENLQAVAIAAGPHWEKMNAEQRRPFEQRAKTQKNGQNIIKYTTTGQNVAVIQKQENERLAKEQKMKENIESTVKVAVATGRIADEMFYFVHVNHFCYCNSEKRYYPAEIAIARFTLVEGVNPDNVYHMIVKPGSLPLGYLSQAQVTSRESHQLPPPMGGDDDENNLTQVMESLLTFMKDLSPNTRNFPPLYCDAKQKPIVENVLLNLCLDFGHPEDLFKVYSMEYLFYILRNNVSPNPQVWPVISMSILELEKDIYDYCREIACQYHEISDALTHCSRSHVIRLAYIICDNCCDDLGIDLIPGLHVPRQANVAASRSRSRASSVASHPIVAKQSSSRHHPWHVPQDNYYLSQRDSEVSEMSETSTVVDPNDIDALGGYDSEFSLTDADGWMQPKQRHRRHDPNNANTFSQSSVSSKDTQDLYFRTPSDGGTSQTSEKQLRRPTKLSAAISGMSSLSMSSNSGAVPKLARGRGRGIAANFTNKMN